MWSQVWVSDGCCQEGFFQIDFQMGLVSVGMMLRVKMGVAIEWAWSG